MQYLEYYRTALGAAPNLLCALAFFFAFQKLRLGSVGAVNRLASATLGVYVIHQTPAVMGLLWTGLAAVITVVNGLNAFGKKGVPTMEIYAEEEDEEPSPAREDHDHIPSTALNPRERLEQLKTLKEAGLLTDAEYRNKREEILKGL